MHYVPGLMTYVLDVVNESQSFFGYTHRVLSLSYAAMIRPQSSCHPPVIRSVLIHFTIPGSPVSIYYALALSQLNLTNGACIAYHT